MELVVNAAISLRLRNLSLRQKASIRRFRQAKGDEQLRSFDID